MALAYLAMLEERRNHRIPRLFRDRRNPLTDFTDMELMSRYRLDRGAILYLVDLLRDDLERQTRRSNALSCEHQVFIALRYMASSCLLRDCGDIHGVSKQTVSHCIHDFSKALSSKVGSFIHFPETTAEIKTTMSDFYAIDKFPCVIGCIDGTLIPIKGPTDSQEEPLYMCRKLYHAINVQAVCNAKEQITNLVVKWPGSTHDAYMYNSSGLSSMLEQGTLQNLEGIEGHWLLGDSAYGVTPTLLTPFLLPKNDAEKKFNVAQRRTRSVIERTFGVWKSRFLCLHKWGRPLLFSPERCCKIITATAILHNICNLRQLPVIDDNGQVVNITPEEHVDDLFFNGEQRRDGVRTRENLVNTVFS